MKPKILICIDWYKPGYKAGGPIRSVSNLITHLKNSYDFYVITRDTDYLEIKPYESIKSNEWNDVDGAQVYYQSINNQNKNSFKKLIEQVNPQIIYCNSLYSPKYTLTPIRIARKKGIKTIVAVRGMLSKGSLSVKSHKKKVFLSIVKTVGLFNKSIFHATSLQEKEDIINNFGSSTSIITAPNLPEKKNNRLILKPKQSGSLKIVSVGRIAPEKNTLYALDVLKDCRTNIEFDLFGPVYNQEYFEQCKKAINQLPSNIVVNYKGSLNHELLDDTLKNYHTIYLPSTGENFGHSILEGMVNSCVPVISDKTPWTNLKEINVGYDIDLNSPQLFCKAIDELANMSETQINEKAQNAYNYAQEIINNKDLIEEYHKLFQLNN